MSAPTRTPAIGSPLVRRDGPEKVAGRARYTYEHQVERPAYLHPVQATVARGRIRSIDASEAEALDGVLLVLNHENAARLADDEDREFWLLQDPEVGFRGQYVAAVVAESPEIAREAASRVRIEYEAEAHDTVLRIDHPELYAPEQVNPAYETDTDEGDVDAALASAAVTLDATYSTPMEHNNPMEPHTSVATWDGQLLTLHESTQGVHTTRTALAPLLGLEPEQLRVYAPHVGGGFGSKGTMHVNAVLACLAAFALPGRAIKHAVTRQQMFAVVGHRTPTIQRVRLGASADGRLTALVHDVVEHTSRMKEFAEQTAVCSRNLYASPNRRTSHRLAPLDVPVPSWMRAPGEMPGMVASEIAMDELAEALELDPIELRRRNEPETDPETGLPWSSRNLLACLDEGAERFGWSERSSIPGERREGAWRVGLGVAASTYPVHAMPGSEAAIRHEGDGRYLVRIGAADIGTGTWTTLSQIAADALGVPADAVTLEIGDTDLPNATVAGGSSGMTSWGSAVVAVARAFRERHGKDPAPGAEVAAQAPQNPDAGSYAMHAFGAQFAEARVHVATGEVRVQRMLGVFAAGRIINPRTARSQFLGGMTMGLSAALHEQSVIDPRFGHVVNHDLAEYHVASNADVREMEAHWIEEDDPHVNPMGSKGIGEIGIVGSPAAIANAIHNATGIRVRDLPITPDKLLT